MASKKTSSLAIFLALNLFFFALSEAIGSCSVPKPKPKPRPKPTPVRATTTTCPRDAVKLAVCANVLDGLVNLMAVNPPVVEPCCTLIKGLPDHEAAMCLCTAIKANVLGAKRDAPVSLNLLLNACGNEVCKDFQCA